MSDFAVNSAAAVSVPLADPIRAEVRSSKRELSATDVAQRLGRQLTPVVLDLGATQPRFASYLEWDETTGAALLSPIAGAALRLALPGGSDRIRIRSSDPVEPWMLTVRGIQLADDQTAVVDLEHAVVTRLRDRVPGRTRVFGQEPLVLAVQDSNGSIEGHVFPVIGLGASHCLIDATRPLDLGDIGPVDVIGDRRIIRRTSARVIEVIPWVTAHGHRRFRCRLVLDTPAMVASPEAGHDLLSESDRVTRLFDLASMMGLDGWYDAPGWPRARMRLLDLRHHLVILSVDERPPEAIPLPNEIRIGFELFAMSYEARVRLHRWRGGRLYVALPLVMRRCRRRREQRALVPDSMTITLTFRNPATGEVVRRRVSDLSFGGLCFAIDASEDVLWKGACLEAARLEWNDDRMALGDLEVRDIEKSTAGKAQCHVVNRGLGPSQSPGFTNLLASLYHPDAERHDGTDFPMMVKFYERAGLLGEFMLRNLRPVLPAAATTWRKLHDKHSSVACTLLFRGSSAEPCAAFSGVRVWEKTWLAQHFGALPTADRRATGMLQVAYVDFVMPQPDTHYMAFFVRAGNVGMNAFYERFFDLTGTPESVTRVTLGLWMLRRAGSDGKSSGPRGYDTRPMSAADEIVVSRAAERVLGPMTTTALSFVPKGFDLPETSRRFARLDLERTRAAFVVAKERRITVALLKERTSPGVNLTWMLDAWWLIPVGNAEDAAIAAAAAEIIRAPFERPEGDKFLIVPAGAPTAALGRAGFEKVLDAHLYVLNRSGLSRYYDYIRDRYGELGAKVTRHEARLSRSAS
jgi:hypothetical protein